VKFCFYAELLFIYKGEFIAIKIKKRYQGRQREVNNDIFNEKIRAAEMLVLSPEGEKLGVMSKADAMAEAAKFELDLVLIAPQGKPPVAKIVDYGKYRYERKKKEQENKKKQKTVEQKEVRITPSIGQHDMETKARNAVKFLAKGHKVKVSLAFRGRENANKEFGMETMRRFLDLIGEEGTLEKEPKLNGRFYDAYLAPKK